MIDDETSVINEEGLSCHCTDDQVPLLEKIFGLDNFGDALLNHVHAAP